MQHISVPANVTTPVIEALELVLTHGFSARVQTCFIWHLVNGWVFALCKWLDCFLLDQTVTPSLWLFYVCFFWDFLFLFYFI